MKTVIGVKFRGGSKVYYFDPGELPVQEAFTGKTNPAYDDGKTMYELCMGYLDKAIENFGKQQNTTAPALSAGDLWNGGEVSK